MMSGFRTDWLMLPTAAPQVQPPLKRFFDGTQDGDFIVPFCQRCEQPMDFDQLRCEHCELGQPEWRSVANHARVVSSVTMHRIEKNLVKTAEPYGVAEVELASGHRLFVSTSQPTTRRFREGEDVTLTLVALGDVLVPRIDIDEEQGS